MPKKEQTKYITRNYVMEPFKYTDKNKKKTPSTEGRMLFTVDASYLKPKIQKILDEKGYTNNFITICPYVISDNEHIKGKKGTNEKRLENFRFKKPAETIFVNCWITKYWVDRIMKMPDNVEILVSGEYDASDYDNIDDKTGSFILRKTVFLEPGKSLLIPNEETKDYKSDDGYYITSVSGRYLTAKNAKGVQNLHLVELPDGEKFVTANIGVLGERYNPETKERENMDHKLSDYGYEDAKEKVYVTRNFKFDEKGNEQSLVENNPDRYFAFLMRYDMSKDSKKGKDDFYGTKLPTYDGSMLMLKPYKENKE